MSEVVCARCGEQNPSDARFCVDCGTTLHAAPATGVTVQLGGPVCGVCGVPNPKDAQFCANCGRSLVPEVHAGPPQRVPRPQRAPRPATPPPPPQQRRNNWGRMNPVLFAGMMVLLLVMFFNVVASNGTQFHVPGFIPLLFLFWWFGGKRGRW